MLPIASARRWKRFIPVALVVMLGLAAMTAWNGSLQADDARSTDDGWRRTAHGWENMARWHQPRPNRGPDEYRFAIGDRLSRPAPRWDFHPIVLAALELLAIALGFAMFPAARQAMRRPNGCEAAVRAAV
jgi:hypothetical protein